MAFLPFATKRYPSWPPLDHPRHLLTLLDTEWINKIKLLNKMLMFWLLLLFRASVTFYYSHYRK